jgi:hypothetical protein
MPCAPRLKQHQLLFQLAFDTILAKEAWDNLCCADGDGMVHAVRIKDGKAAYCNRFVDTARLQHERKAGYGVFSKVSGEEGAAVVL